MHSSETVVLGTRRDAEEGERDGEEDGKEEDAGGRGTGSERERQNWLSLRSSLDLRRRRDVGQRRNQDRWKRR